jgi:hypothetical protein
MTSPWSRSHLVALDGQWKVVARNIGRGLQFAVSRAGHLLIGHPSAKPTGYPGIASRRLMAIHVDSQHFTEL